MYKDKKIRTKARKQNVAISKNVCNGCKYLSVEYRACCHPDLNGRGIMLDCDGIYFKKPANVLISCPEDCSKSKQSKYRNKKVTVDGVTYDSLLEYARFLDLKLLERAGEVKDVVYHKKYPLINKSIYGREIYYEADFVYTDLRTNKLIVEDVKTEVTKTEFYRLKKRLMAEKYGVIITEFEKEKK